MRHIVLLSGGLSSAYIACNLDIPDRILLFTDVKWEHPDLYRFLDDIEKFTKIKITRIADGRSPADLFFDEGYLGNGRIPICSRILKAELTQKFVSKGDILYFGITHDESHRCKRIIDIYSTFEVTCLFPLVTKPVPKNEIINFFESNGIKIPELYQKGFKHNNCYGGCVRQGINEWIKLLQNYPEVYQERENLEQTFSELIRPSTFLKNISLKELRERYEKQLSLPFENDFSVSECIGVCTYEN